MTIEQFYVGNAFATDAEMASPPLIGLPAVIVSFEPLGIEGHSSLKICAMTTLWGGGGGNTFAYPKINGLKYICRKLILTQLNPTN